MSNEPPGVVQTAGVGLHFAKQGSTSRLCMFVLGRCTVFCLQNFLNWILPHTCLDWWVLSRSDFALPPGDIFYCHN